MKRSGVCLLMVGGLLGLAGCQNDGASYMIAGDKDHSISLLREQRYPWSDEMTQRVVVARYPECQRRFEIVPGSTQGKRLDLYEIGPRLYVLRQDQVWYAVGTEKCAIEKFDEAPSPVPGTLLGSFRLGDEKLKFFPEAEGKKP